LYDRCVRVCVRVYMCVRVYICVCVCICVSVMVSQEPRMTGVRL